MNTKMHGLNDMYSVRRKMIEGFTNIGSSAANDFINNIRNNGDNYEDY